MKFVQDFFSVEKLEESASFANVVLIPKIGGTNSFEKFRLISLCNFNFKLTTKIITTRLMKHLDKFISLFQSAFVPDRWIAENTILVGEVVGKMKRKQGRESDMGIKIDMSKVYNGIEWPFLLNVLTRFGMSEKVISLNGAPLDKIKLERSLRQGDPLFSYLFIVGTEVLSRLLKREEEKGNINGIAIGISVLETSHLM